MTREEIRDKIWYFVGEDASAPAFYTKAMADQAIQEGLELIAEEIKTLRQQAILVTEPGRHWYTIYEVAENCMSPFRIWTDGTNQRLIPLTIDEVDDHYTTWLSVNSNQPQWWYPISFDTFGIWPGASEGGTILRIDYLAWPETLIDDTDEPVFQEIEQDLVILYGEYDALIREWKVERAMDLFNKFATAYRDAQFRSEVRRYHRQFFDRSFHGGYDGRVE